MCETKDGLHIWEDHFYPEIIDPVTEEVLPDGEIGELVFTTLSKEALPMVRYRTRDLTRLLPGTARSMRRMEKITGRSDDMIILRGVNVFPTQIEEQILKCAGLAPHFQIELSTSGRMDDMTVHVECTIASASDRRARRRARNWRTTSRAWSGSPPGSTLPSRARWRVPRARPSAWSTTGTGPEVMARTIAKDHEAKREAILKTAAVFFAKQGFDRASMVKLADACGVSKALIYHYYPSKDALLFDILDTHLTALVEVVETTAAQPGTASERLRALVRAILIAYRDSDAEHKVQLDALSSLPEDKQTHLRALQRRLVACMSDCVRQIEPERFTARPELLAPVTMSVFGMLNWFYLWYKPGGPVDRDAYADIVADLVIGGLPAVCSGAAKS